jgi:hypothetical protein
MPRIVEQPDELGDFPRMNCEDLSRRKVKVGVNKWYQIRDEIDHVKIGARRFYTDDALRAYLRRKTQRGQPNHGTRSDAPPQRSKVRVEQEVSTTDPDEIAEPGIKKISTPRPQRDQRDSDKEEAKGQ